MALGTKFSIIQSFIKNKEVIDIKNHFYSKLRTYLSYQLAKLKSENFFKDIDAESYQIKKILSLVLSNKIPTMILNKNIIKELILKEEQKKKNRKEENFINNEPEEKKDKNKSEKKRGRPSKKNFANKNNNILKNKKETEISKNENPADKKFIYENIGNSSVEKLNKNNMTIDLNASDIPNYESHFNFNSK